MAQEEKEQSTCDTYLPPAIAAAAGITGAIEGFAFGGPLGAVTSATLQAVGGYHIADVVCDRFFNGEPETPMATPQPSNEVAQLPKSPDRG